jgi:chromosome partitioning protein
VLTATLCNQKGGCGKTSSTLLLAGAAAALELKVLVIDLDQQGNASAALGVNGNEQQWSAYEVLDQSAPGVAQAAAVDASSWPGVSVIPSTRALANLNLSTELALEGRLRVAMEGLEGYDLVLIDTPPAVDRMTANALTASDVYVIVTTATKFSLDGVAALTDTVTKVQSFLNSDLQVAGAIVNGLRSRTREGALRLEELRASLGTAVWEPAIPERQVIREMEGAGVPLHEFGRDARDVLEVVDVLLARLLWLDPEYRAAHLDRNPAVVYAEYLARTGATQEVRS